MKISFAAAAFLSSLCASASMPNIASYSGNYVGKRFENDRPCTVKITADRGFMNFTVTEQGVSSIYREKIRTLEQEIVTNWNDDDLSVEVKVSRVTLLRPIHFNIFTRLGVETRENGVKLSIWKKNFSQGPRDIKVGDLDYVLLTVWADDENGSQSRNAGCDDLIKN